MTFEDLLKKMIEMQAADLFITANKEACVKVHGRVEPVSDSILSAESASNIILGIMSEDQKKEFLETHEVNFAIDVKGCGRFRANCFMQKSNMGAVLRRIESVIPELESLHLPPILSDLIMQERGLILYVGGTGSGKSTSLASMINYRNENSAGHILTVEDPIEFVHQHKGNIVTQREVGIDTETFDIALKNALRQAPNLVLIGEIRSQEIMEYAIQFAETGHLCLATLHANNSNQALDRVVNFFPPEHHGQLWLDLSLNLRAIIGQRLIPTLDDKGRVPAIEVLINTPTISDNIKKGRVDNIKQYIEKGTEFGMQTFDQSLLALYIEGKISYEHALKNADSENNLRLAIKFAKQKGEVSKAAAIPEPQSAEVATEPKKKVEASPDMKLSLGGDKPTGEINSTTPVQTVNPLTTRPPKEVVAPSEQKPIENTQTKPQTQAPIEPDKKITASINVSTPNKDATIPETPSVKVLKQDPTSQPLPEIKEEEQPIAKQPPKEKTNNTGLKFKDD